MKLRKKKIKYEQLVFGGNKKEKLPREHTDYKPVKELCRSTKKAMIIITINLPEWMVNWLNDKSKKKIYSSRSYMIREALREFIRKEEGFIDYIDKKYNVIGIA